MNRRNFFRLLGGAVAGIALEQAIPLGRVWSFPSQIVVAPTMPHAFGFPMEYAKLAELGNLGCGIGTIEYIQVEINGPEYLGIYRSPFLEREHARILEEFQASIAKV